MNLFSPVALLSPVGGETHDDETDRGDWPFDHDRTTVQRLATIEEVATVIPFDEHPPGLRLVVELDLAMNGPIRRETARRIANRQQWTTVQRSDVPTAPGDWASHAACKGQRMWYSTLQAQNGYKHPRQDREMEQAALETCERCPVLIQCRMWALQDNDPAVDHVAGGMTPRQRWQWRRGHR